jgi:hypothetical protein
MPASYSKDFYGWTQEQAALLRAGRLVDADIEHIIEEVEAMGRSERRELMHRLRLLLAHLLKWRYQPERRGNSWRHTIRNQRRDVQDLLDENPSLGPQIPAIVTGAYERARDDACAETGLAVASFPAPCPFALSEILDPDFLPE